MTWTAFCVECGDELTDKETLNGWSDFGTFCDECAESEGLKG